MKQKELVMIAGPNGAGKTTMAMQLLPDLLDRGGFTEVQKT